MNRKRILLCRNQTEDFNSLLRLTSYYFSSSNNILVNLHLKSNSTLSEKVSTAEVMSPVKKRTRSAISRLPNHKSGIRGYEATFRDLQREAQFSDILVIEQANYQQLCQEYDIKKSTRYSLFSCPTLVAPAGEDRVNHIILVDDGKPGTYRRIKQMACLFPKLCLATPTTLFITRPPDSHVPAQEEKLWIEYLKLHFAHLAVYRVDQRSMHMLPDMIDYKKNALLISPSDISSAPLYQALEPITQFKLII